MCGGHGCGGTLFAGLLTCLLATLLFTLPSFLPLLRMVLALRGERASERAPFFRCSVGTGGSDPLGRVPALSPTQPHTVPPVPHQHMHPL